MNGHPLPVSAGSGTVAVRHRVRRGAEAPYEDWIRRVTRAANGFPGHAGVNVVRPGAGSRTYTLLVRFGTEAEARAWMASPERRAFVDAVRPLLVEAEDTEVGGGLEFWFTPARESVPRHRQFLVTLSAIYPLSLAVGYAVARVPAVLPAVDHPAILGLIGSAAIVGAMTYLIMPPYTRLIGRWLHK